MSGTYIRGGQMMERQTELRVATWGGGDRDRAMPIGDKGDGTCFKKYWELCISMLTFRDRVAH